MKLPVRHHLVLAAAIAVSAFGIAVAAVPVAQAAPTASKPLLIDCSIRGSVEPRAFTIACADGNDFLSGLKWTHWGNTAGGKGTEWINTCNPNCASGHFQKFGTKVYLWRVKPRPHVAGQRYFTRMELTYPGKVPKGFPRQRTIDLWANA